MRPLVPSFLVFVAASLLAAPAIAQQLYKYVGPDGRTHYTDRPPAEARKAEKVTSSRVSSVPGTANSASGDAAKATALKSAAEQEQAFRQRRLEAAEKAQKEEKLAEEKRQRAQTCAQMRRDVAGMQAGGRYARVNEKGERIFLEDAQIQQEIARMQQEIAANCS
jgi:hypothetical protein